MDFETGDGLIGLKESLSAHAEATEWPTSDLDPDEYARDNDLTVDSLRDPWPDCIDHRLLATISPLVQDGGLFEVEGLPECLFREVIPAPEQLQMSAPSLKLIQEVCKSVAEPEVAGLMAELRSAVSSEPKPVSKFEVPVLRTDHETDCRQLARRIALFRDDHLADHRLPLHPVNDEMGESVEFSAKAKRGDEAVMKGVEGESLEMTRGTFLFLSQCLKTDRAEADIRAFLDEAYTYKGVRSREHLTPPLSPQLQPSDEYYIPDPETCELPIPSSSSSAALAAELDAAESNILKDDIQFWATAVSQQIPSPERYNDLDIPAMLKAGDLSAPSPFSSPHPPPRSLKMDVPLLPNSSNTKDEHPHPTRVLTAEDLAQAKTFIDSSDTLSAGPGDRSDEQFAEFLRAQAAAVARAAEQEKLQPLDGTLRMPVRVMDFSLPAPEWGACCACSPADMFRWIQKATDTVWQSPRWPANKLAEQAMVWRPLAHMDRAVAAREGISCDARVLGGFVGVPGEEEVWRSEDLVEKNRGLVFRRPRDDCDSEVDVEEEMYEGWESPGVSEVPIGRPYQPEIYQPEKQPRQLLLDEPSRTQLTPSSLDSPSMPDVHHSRLYQPELHQPEKQRRLLLDEPPRTRPTPSSDNMALQSLRTPTAQTQTPVPPLQDLSTLWRARKRTLDEMEQQRRPTPEPTNLLAGFLGQHVDSAPLIQNFIQITTAHKKPKLTNSSFFGTPTPAAAPPTKLNKEEAARLMPPPPKPVLAFSPEITPPAIPPKVIVSHHLTKEIVHHIKTALPTLVLIERDYSIHPPTNNIPMDEADLTISPATGLLFTTMVHLRQRPAPIPGSTTPPIFRHLLTTVAARYERLVVLVCEATKHSDTVNPLSQSDAKALAEAQGLAAGTPGVQLLYVGGGYRTMGRWAAHVICAHAHEAAAEQKLVLAVETGWEVFLRRAGMNAYAAQVALGRLKVPDGEAAMGGGGGRRYGLPLLVGMEAEEREEVLGAALGGTRVLERVGRVVDGGWGRGGGLVGYRGGAPAGGYGGVGGRGAHGVGASPGGYRGMGM
ncbi:hypothetical protein QBC39DRAFT_407234 [Podospora conica]|nr:hypothetical protein QBC39DRAFT_407234 [Schizothecium conicum]